MCQCGASSDETIAREYDPIALRMNARTDIWSIDKEKRNEARGFQRSAAHLQMYDRPVFATRPPVRAIGKAQTEECGRSDRFPFAPGETTIGRSIEHPALAHDPAFLLAGEPNFQQISESRTGTSAGQRLIDPLGATVGCLKQRPGIADHPTVHWIGEHDVKQGHRPLRLLWRPGGTPVVRRQDRSQCPDNRPLLIVQKVGGIEGGRGTADLFRPVLAAIRRMKDRAASPDHPSDRWRGEGDCVQRLLRIEGLLQPGVSAIRRATEKSPSSRDPAVG